MTRAILKLEEVTLAYAYQEILAEGIEQGIEQEAYKMALRVLQARFEDGRGFEELLSGLAAADLEWLVGQVFQIQTVAELQQRLRARADASAVEPS